MARRIWPSTMMISGDDIGSGNGRRTSSPNTFLWEPPAARANPRAYEDADGVYSPHDNRITVLQRRGAVFLACHNEI